MSDDAIDPQTLHPDRFIDSDHPDVLAFALEHAAGLPPRESAVALYYAVRDGFRYSPWNVAFERSAFRASALLRREPRQGHCIDKALLLAAVCRARQIPARLHFANVRNHVGTAQLEARLGSDLLVYHGYVELYLDGRWVAATPAFNRELCDRLGVVPLEFDGRNDSIFQAYDRAAGRFMEYVTDHGSHNTLPFDAMIAEWRRHYPRIAAEGWPSPPSGDRLS
ncbi:MAG: transglutaminase family protein [Deltaproteobacteria bacterium]|nr:MAG: transglutaminase family protein [Deltaproteobacteria bacterium]